MAEKAMAASQAEESLVEVAVRDHARLVYRIAYSVLRNAADAEDATQDIFSARAPLSKEVGWNSPGWASAVQPFLLVHRQPSRAHKNLHEHLFRQLARLRVLIRRMIRR